MTSTPSQEFQGVTAGTKQVATQPRPDLQPTLEGDTVILRPVSPDDWTAMFTAASDPLIWEGHPVSNRYTERVFRHFFETAVTSDSAFAILEREGGALIGSSRFLDHRPDARSIEIGFTFLVRRHWGGQTNAEVKRLMLNHAFTFVDIVTFVVGETNWRSRKAMTKIGGVLRDGIIEQTIHATTYRDVVFEVCKLENAMNLRI